MNIPQIKSIGLPPEKHADRVVGEMLTVIANARQKRWARMTDIIGKAPDGNPKAQARMVEKLREAARPFCLAVDLEPGKRGRYTLRLATVEAWNPATKDIVGMDEPLPELPWLALNRVDLTSKGNHRYDQEYGLVLAITHHALSRLAQRCGARTVTDIWHASLMIIRAYADIYAGKTFRDNMRMRVELPRNMGVAICPLVKYADGEGGVVVATLWKEGEEG